MKRRTRDETVARFRSREVEPEALAIKCELEGWASVSLDRLRDSRPAIPDVLSDRLRELERAGVLQRARLAAPAASRVYAKRSQTELIH